MPKPKTKRRLVSNEEFEKEYRKKENLNVISWYCRKFGKNLPPDEIQACGYRGLWRALEIHNPTRGKLVTILGACVKNECKKTLLEHNKFSNRHISGNFDNERTHEQEYDIQSLLSSVNNQEKNIILLKYYEGKTFKEIGHQYGLTKQRIQQIMARAFDKIRRSDMVYNK